MPRIRGKTDRMLKAEELIGMPLESALPIMLTEREPKEVAKLLKISSATLSFWVLRLRISYVTVAIADTDKVHVDRADRSVQKRHIDALFKRFGEAGNE